MMGHGTPVIALVFRAFVVATALTLCASADDQPVSDAETTVNNAEHVGAAASNKDRFKYEGIAEQPRPDLTAMLSRLFWGTALTLIACCVTLWLVKEFLRRQTVHPQGDEKLKLIGALAISRRCSIQLVEADGKQIIVALDNGSLRSVVPLPESFDSELLDPSEQLLSGSHAAGPAEVPPEHTLPLKAA